MGLYVCPECEVLIDVHGLVFFTSHCRCNQCGYEGSIFKKKEWPKNYISHLLCLRMYYTEAYHAVKDQAHRPDMKYYHGLVFSTGDKIHDICRRYGVDFNEIKSFKVK